MGDDCPCHDDAIVKSLVASIVERGRTLASFGVIEAPTLRPGATAAELERLRAHVGRELPPSLVALLTHTNGASSLFVFFDLLGVDDMLPGAPAYARASVLKRLARGAEPLVPSDALVIADKGGDQPDCIYLDPSRTDGAGEWSVVTFDHEADVEIDESLPAFLARIERRLGWMIEDAKSTEMVGFDTVD